MKVGDTKKATLLGVVAVGAIAFLVIRMVPSGGSKAMTRVAASSTSDSPAAGAKVAVPPMTLVNDPFSHPDLAAKKAKRDDEMAGDAAKAGAGQAPGAGKTDGATASGPDGGHLNPYQLGTGEVSRESGAGSGLPDARPDGSATHPATGSEKGLSGPPAPPKPIDRPQVSLMLNGVVSAGNSVAFIAIGKDDPKAYEVGEALPTTPAMRVVEIQEGKVILKGKGKTVVLQVGHEAKL